MIEEKRKKINEKQRAFVFIDGSNIFFLQKKLGWLVDWDKIRAFLRANYAVSQLNFYEAHQDEGQGDKEKFFSILKKLKFQIVTKRLKYILDQETGEKIPKANFDVEITRDILVYSFYNRFDFDVIVLFSGDSDFAALASVLKDDFGKKLIVFSGRKNLSWELRVAADKVVYLEDLKKQIFRKNWGLTKRTEKHKIQLSNRRRP